MEPKPLGDGGDRRHGVQPALAPSTHCLFYPCRSSLAPSWRRAPWMKPNHRSEPG